jgi:hypothetical protein
MAAPVLRIGGVDQGLQHIEGGGLHAVAEQECLHAREFLDGGISQTRNRKCASMAGP